MLDFLLDVDTPVELANYLSLNRVICDLEITSRKRLFERLAKLLVIDLEEQDEKKIFRALVEREKLGSTCVGDGLAIPHGRIEGLLEPRIAIVRLAEPVDYGARDNKPIRMAFALLVPKDATDEHLKILGLLAERLSDNDVRQQLYIAGSAQQLFDSFLADSALSKAAG
ncbi:MAG: PTS sugar transporter subunit IIA [Arenicellaceae bacterium]|nr:PTS sugar transporter subunit IIA [Arenicellaceae bacterium]